MRRFPMRSRAGGLRKKTPTTWLVENANVWTGTGLLNLSTGNQAFPLLATPEPMAGGFTAEVTRLRVERIRGSIELLNQVAATRVVCMGIAVVDQVAGVADVWDPASSIDAKKEWMWFDQSVLQAGTLAGPSAALRGTHIPMGQLVDIRVKRVLRPGQQLQLFINCSGANNDIAYGGWLRVLVSRIV